MSFDSYKNQATNGRTLADLKFTELLNINLIYEIK